MPVLSLKKAGRVSKNKKVIENPAMVCIKKAAAAQSDLWDAAILLTTTCSSPQPIIAVRKKQIAFIQLINPKFSFDKQTEM